MVFARFSGPDSIKSGCRFIIRRIIPCFDRASLGLVALQVCDQLILVIVVGLAGHETHYLESEGTFIAFCWIESDVLDVVIVGDGMVSPVVIIVPGGSTGLELFAVVPLEHTWHDLSVIFINDFGVVASQLVGSDCSKVKDLAIDQMRFTHSFLRQLNR